MYSIANQQQQQRIVFVSDGVRKISLHIYIYIQVSSKPIIYSSAHMHIFDAKKKTTPRSHLNYRLDIFSVKLIWIAKPFLEAVDQTHSSWVPGNPRNFWKVIKHSPVNNGAQDSCKSAFLSHI